MVVTVANTVERKFLANTSTGSPFVVANVSISGAILDLAATSCSIKPSDGIGAGGSLTGVAAAMGTKANAGAAIEYGIPVVKAAPATSRAFRTWPRPSVSYRDTTPGKVVTAKRRDSTRTM